MKISELNPQSINRIKSDSENKKPDLTTKKTVGLQNIVSTTKNENSIPKLSTSPKRKFELGKNYLPIDFLRKKPQVLKVVTTESISYKNMESYIRLSQTLLSFRNHGKSCDIILKTTDEKDYKAHKFIIKKLLDLYLKPTDNPSFVKIDLPLNLLKPLVDHFYGIEIDLQTDEDNKKVSSILKLISQKSATDFFKENLSSLCKSNSFLGDDFTDTIMTSNQGGLFMVHGTMLKLLGDVYKKTFQPNILKEQDNAFELKLDVDDETLQNICYFIYNQTNRIIFKLDKKTSLSSKVPLLVFAQNARWQKLVEWIESKEIMYPDKENLIKI